MPQRSLEGRLREVVELPGLDTLEEGAQLPAGSADDHVRIVAFSEEDDTVILRNLYTGPGIRREGRLTPAQFHRSPTLTSLWLPAE